MSDWSDDLWWLEPPPTTPPRPSASDVEGEGLDFQSIIDSIVGLGVLGTVATVSFCAGMVYGVATDGLSTIHNRLRRMVSG